MENKDKILERISKLLRVASSGSGATESEVENALNRVQELLKTHGISQSELGSTSETSVEVFTEEEMNLHTTLYDWEKFLLHCIADTCLCTMLYSKKLSDDFKRAYTIVSFCGRPCDITLGQYLYKYLRSVIVARLRGVSSSSREDFAKGMVISLRSKLDAFRVNVNALVPVGLDDYVKEKYPSLSEKSGYRRLHISSALKSGMAAGRDVEIHRGISPKGIEDLR